MSEAGTMTLAVEALELPAEGVAAPLPGGASVVAFAARDRDGRLRGLAAARQRRSAAMMRVTRFDADEASSPALAAALENAARAGGALAIRATGDVPQAWRFLALAETGRGYAQRWLGPGLPISPRIGAFNQTTGFTCGPVSLAMAMGPTVTRGDEIAIWREATTLIGLTGPGGCDPYGLALAARRRFPSVRLFVDTEEPVLLDRANTEEKRDLMRFVQGEFRRDAEASLPIVRRRAEIHELHAMVEAGAKVLLLIDQCHTHAHPAPHWVLLHAAAGGVFLVNDPWVETDDREVAADTDCLPTTAAMLDRMACYGDPPYSAAIVVASEG